MKRALVIFNPVSGYKKWRNIPILIQKTLTEKNYDWIWYETKPKQDLLELFKSQIERGEFDRIIVSGGDGTVAEAVGAMMAMKVKTPLVILPQGSANLVAMSLGLPLFQVKRALQLGLEGKPRILDVMQVNRKYYGVIAVGRGYDAFLVQETPRDLKRKMGLFAYAWIFIKTALFYRSQPYRLSVDGERTEVVAKSIMVFNLFPLPFLPIKPHDGVLNVLILTSKGKLIHHTGKTISIKAHKEFRFQVDGEVLKAKTINIETLPTQLSIMAK